MKSFLAACVAANVRMPEVGAQTLHPESQPKADLPTAFSEGSFPCTHNARVVSAKIPDFIDPALIATNPAEEGLEEKFGVVTERHGSKIFLTGRNEDQVLQEFQNLTGQRASQRAATGGANQATDTKYRIDITEHLPARVQTLFGYQTILHGPNCFGTALYTSGKIDFPAYVGDSEVKDYLKDSRSCVQVNKAQDLRKGDYVAFFSKSHSSSRVGSSWSGATLVHIAVAAADGGHWFVSKTSPRNNTRVGVVSDEALYEQIFVTPPQCRFRTKEASTEECFIDATSADGMKIIAWTEAYRCTDGAFPSRAREFKSSAAKVWGAKFENFESLLFARAQGEVHLDPKDLETVQTELNTFIDSEESFDDNERKIMRNRYNALSNLLTMSDSFSNGYQRDLPDPVTVRVSGSVTTIEALSPMNYAYDLRNLWGEYRLNGSVDWIPVPLDDPFKFRVTLTNLERGEHWVQVRFRNSYGGGSAVTAWHSFVLE